MRQRLLFCALGIVFSLHSTLARADGPRISSDGLYVGVRVEPGAAFTLAYDLDIYLGADRTFSLGPAASLSFLGQSGSEFGRRQDFLIAVDVLRFKFALSQNASFRPYLLLGGGFDYAQLPQQAGSPREVTLDDGTTTTAHLNFPEQSAINGMMSVGVGVDAYLQSNFGLTAALVSHVRFGEEERVPRFWAELLFGIRFGL